MDLLITDNCVITRDYITGDVTLKSGKDTVVLKADEVEQAFYAFLNKVPEKVASFEAAITVVKDLQAVKPKV